jgi:hypothetical protein
MVARFILENIALRALGPVLPPYLPGPAVPIDSAGQYAEFSRMDDEQLTETIRTNALGIPMVFPLEIKKPDEHDFWLLPWEPLITIVGKNTIVKRNVAKKKYRGSIKEYWSQDDYSVNIGGILMSADSDDIYPKDDVRRLRGLCEAQAELEVISPLLNIYDIFRIVVEDFDFPFTKGASAQTYTLKCSSDDPYDLLIPLTQ